MRVGRCEIEHDFYAILGIATWSTDADIRRAHRRLARKHHPDLTTGDREQTDRHMKLVNLAASVLLDPSARARYDVLRQGRSFVETDAPASPPTRASAPRRGRSVGRGVWSMGAAAPMGASSGSGAPISSRLFVIALAATALVACAAQLTRTHVPVASSDYRIPEPPQMATIWSPTSR